MKAAALVPVALAAIATGVSAQTSATMTTTPCVAQNILEACLSNTQGYISDCSATDSACLCDKYTAIMTCFKSCPDDVRSSTYASKKEAYCLDASLYSSKTAAPTVTAASDGGDGDDPNSPRVTGSSANATSTASGIAGAALSFNWLGSAAGVLAVAAGILAAAL